MRALYPLLLLAFIYSCQYNPSNYKYTETETNLFLDNIIQNIKVQITDITEIERQPTNKFLIYTRYPLSEIQLEEYNKVGYLLNRDDDISDFAKYTFKKYELVNEKNEKVQFFNNGRAIYLQEFGIWEYNNILYQNLGIDTELNMNYEKLSGYIIMEFEMPYNIKKEVKIPVNISIYDTNNQ
ncbi:hypothetical protein [Dysgonomonas macrotermitis]|uniref:Uncharacterized protein n=1 Tax=Dysgonomonas macrotermitis TaxID=1346286 RepID=A0A1M4UQ64_9BACT|nr:hypothetical protein [Dysgonomonas macrotermitis]SHE58740.1 hypothetical protein SAMN05444362_101663 [Dysgonomonas macrotermitis]